MRILDLFCGAGGASMGYHQAGHEVVGVDINKQKHYPFEFIQADALTVDLSDFDAIHASPPCQEYTNLKKLHQDREYPDLIDPIRERLIGAGVPYIIENVMGAPLRDPLKLCGSMFDLEVRRHRLFETNFTVPQPSCDHKKQGHVIGVYGHPGGRSARRGPGRGAKNGNAEDWRRAMGIDWMVVRELSQAIPPAYTRYIGQFLP
jgi:DNA (cytosine-5)-methyltransferase 1